jgi:hypothetical protein
MSARGIRRLATRSDIRAATLVGVVAAALCVELNVHGTVGGIAFASRAAADSAPPREGEVAQPAMLTASSEPASGTRSRADTIRLELH